MGCDGSKPQVENPTIGYPLSPPAFTVVPSSSELSFSSPSSSQVAANVQWRKRFDVELASAKARGPMLQVINTTKLALDDMDEIIYSLHSGLSSELKSKPLRLIRVENLLKWEKLKCYEQVKPQDYLEIPYSETTDDLWHECAVVSWRWHSSKPQVMTTQFSPMNEVQMLHLQVILHQAKECGIAYVWIDWSCVPQYSDSSMVEVLRSKLFYARARVQIVLPQFKPLPSGMVSALLHHALRAARKQRDGANMEGDMGMAITTLTTLLERGEVAGREYFGRVWTLAERLARGQRNEKLNQWMSLDIWLGMVVDALLNSSEDRSAANIYWSKLMPAHLRQQLDNAMDKLKVALATEAVQAPKGLEVELMAVFEGAVEAWRTSSMAEMPNEDWLKLYLTKEAVKVYEAFYCHDFVWAVYSYFTWKQPNNQSIRAAQEALQNLCRVVEIECTETTIHAVLEKAAEQGSVPKELEVSGGPSLLSQMIKSKDAKLTCTATWKPHEDVVWCLALSRDGATLVSTSLDKTLAVWDAATGRLSCTLQGHTDVVTCVVLTPDGRSVISGSIDKTIRVWSLAPSSSSPPAGQGSGGGTAMTVVGAPQVTTTEGEVVSMALSGDGRLLATGHNSPHHILLWRVELQQHTSQNDQHTGGSSGSGGVVLRRHDGCGPLTGHLDGVACLVMTCDGKTLVSGSADKTMRMWSLPQGQCLRTIEGHSHLVIGLALTLDEAILVSASYEQDNTVRLWQLSSGAQLACIKGSFRVAVSPDGSTLVSCSEDLKQVAVWDLAAIMLDPAAHHQPRTITTECDECPIALAIAPDGSCFFSGHGDGSVRLWRPTLP